MCYLKPLRVKKLEGKIAYLENGIRAFYDKKIGVIKPNDSVLVFGNLIAERLKEK
jgi:hypothetical protein